MLGRRSTVYINLLPKVPQYSVPVSASVNNTDVGGGGRKEGRKKQRGVFLNDATAAAKASINVDVRCTMYDVRCHRCDGKALRKRVGSFLIQ